MIISTSRNRKLKLDRPISDQYTYVSDEEFEKANRFVHFQRPNPSARPTVTASELALYRLIFMLLNYMVGYISHPKRILRTLRNIFSDDVAETVLEHRIKDALKRRRLVSAQK